MPPNSPRQTAGIFPAEMIVGHLRGGRFDSQEVIHERSLRYLKDPFHFPFGAEFLPEKALFEGLAYIGSPGSGKTVGMNQVKRNRLSHVGKGYGHRVFIWDFKGKERCYLDPLELDCPIHYINPIDVRECGIDLAAELTGPLEADGFAAEVIMPWKGTVNGEDGSTFLLASQAVFAEVIKVFQETAGQDWRFIDVLQACRSERNLRDVLPWTIDGEAIVEDLFGAQKQAKGIMFTLRANFFRLLPLAAAMTHCEENISLRSWVEEEESVLVLHNVDFYEANLAQFFRWVFKHTLRLVMSRSKDRGETYTFFIDEAQRAPFAEDLIKLATEGRDYRAGFALGFQDVQGMRRVLTPDGTGELFSCCSTQAYYQNNNPETAKFGSERFGTQVLLTAEHSASVSRNVSTNAPNLTNEQKEGLIRAHMIEKRDKEPKEARRDERHESLYAEGWGTHGTGRVPGGVEKLALEHYGVIPPGLVVSEQESTSDSQSVSFKMTEFPMVYSSEILHLAKPDPLPEPGVDLETQALVASTFLGNWLEIAYGMQDVTLCPDRTLTVFEKRGDDELRFYGWDDRDRERLGLVSHEAQRPRVDEDDDD
jgi:hypothetical protein